MYTRFPRYRLWMNGKHMPQGEFSIVLKSYYYSKVEHLNLIWKGETFCNTRVTVSLRVCTCRHNKVCTVHTIRKRNQRIIIIIVNDVRVILYFVISNNLNFRRLWHFTGIPYSPSDISLLKKFFVHTTFQLFMNQLWN